MVEAGEDLVDQPFVVGDELALLPALGAVPEDVEGRAAQEFELRHQTEGAEHPGPIARFTG